MIEVSQTVNDFWSCADKTATFSAIDDDNVIENRVFYSHRVHMVRHSGMEKCVFCFSSVELFEYFAVQCSAEATDSGTGWLGLAGGYFVCLVVTSAFLGGYLYRGNYPHSKMPRISTLE